MKKKLVLYSIVLSMCIISMSFWIGYAQRAGASDETTSNEITTVVYTETV